MSPQITYHLQVNEKGVFQHDIFIFNPKIIKENYDVLTRYSKEIIVTEIHGHSEEIVSPEKLESLLSLS